MKVLVVEDDAALQATLQRTLARRGFVVATAGDGVAALQRWAATPPDAVVLDLSLPGLDGLQVLAQARAQGLGHAGGVHPPVAWALVQAGQAVLVDVRTAEERKFVGQVPDTLHVPWATGTALTRNPRFARELVALAAKHPDQTLLLLCRSGKRSALAAEVAAQQGLSRVFNVSEGFEGDLDEATQRGHFNGWRFYGLPWTQD